MAFDSTGVSGDADSAGQAACDARTDARILADIAYRYPELRGVILANPATYPGLRDWILARPQPVVAGAAPVIGEANALTPGEDPSGPAPQPPTRKNQGASPLVALAIAAGILVVGALIVTATVVADGVEHAAKSVGASQTSPSASGNGGTPQAAPYAPSPGEAVFGAAAVDDAFFTAQQAAGFGRAGQATSIHSTAGEASAVLAQLWATRAAQPADTTCRFASSTMPVFGDEKPGGAGEAVSSVNGVAALATSSAVNQSARVFSNAAEAGAYISRLQKAASSCTTIDVGDLQGSVLSDNAGTITPHAAWIIDGVFDGTPGKLYVVDMRHDNMVLRTEVFVAATDDAAVSPAVIDGIQNKAEQNLIDTKP
ncbi:variant leucine-rich repeat-containing protein [Subtercola lobariae]|uniref:Leucine rich repeat variant domain-containing protein n=1 Tax=Subtercola lobariae TaxID=1588641 RepID=A0A917B4A6_9MICO|nr:hypothetical protein [Subtercola lobariae]GGF18940.1 hypothetical protein GCM10011399_10670 [Subtercola lobariae]